MRYVYQIWVESIRDFRRFPALDERVRASVARRIRAHQGRDHGKSDQIGAVPLIERNGSGGKGGRGGWTSLQHRRGCGHGNT